MGANASPLRRWATTCHDGDGGRRCRITNAQHRVTAALAAKRLIRRALDTSFGTIYEESRQLLAECLASEEAAAARAAWRQRRNAKG
jgi:hypothetical protein